MFEIIIQENGDLLIPRGTDEDNDFYRSLLDDTISEDSLEMLDVFFGMKSEKIFGNRALCG